MPAKKPINQLDPFGDNDDRYQTREIRHSRSRSSKNPFTNLADPKSKEGKRSFIILSCVACFLFPSMEASSRVSF